MARRFRAETKSSLAKAWLTIALRCTAKIRIAAPEDAKLSGDIMLASLEALGHPEGNYRFLKAGGRA